MDYERVYSFAALAVTAAVALLVGVVIAAGALLTLEVPGGKGSTAATAPTPVAPAVAPTAVVTPTADVCRDNVARFVQTVRTRVDPDGDELQGITDAALVQLGHAALKQPSVLESTRLVPFQRPRFVGAANQWLCH